MVVSLFIFAWPGHRIHMHADRLETISLETIMTYRTVYAAPARETVR
jgi:hypothetical protein